MAKSPTTRRPTSSAITWPSSQDSSRACIPCCREVADARRYFEDHMKTRSATGSDSTRDVRRRNLSKQQLDDWLDDALADTFPASDAVASPPSGIGPVGRADDSSKLPADGTARGDRSRS